MGLISTSQTPFYHSPSSLFWVHHLRPTKTLYRQGEYVLFGFSSFNSTKQRCRWNAVSREGKYRSNMDFRPTSWRLRVMQESNTVSMDKINSRGYSGVSTLSTEDEIRLVDYPFYRTSTRANWNTEITNLRKTRTLSRVGSECWTNNTKSVLKAEVDTLKRNGPDSFPIELNHRRNQYLTPIQIPPSEIHVKGSSDHKLWQAEVDTLKRNGPDSFPIELNHGRNPYLTPTQIPPSEIHVKGSSDHKLWQAEVDTLKRNGPDSFPIELNHGRNQYLTPTQIPPSEIYVNKSSDQKLWQAEVDTLKRNGPDSFPIELDHGRNQYLTPTQIPPSEIYVNKSSDQKLRQVGEEMKSRKLDSKSKVHKRVGLAEGVANTPQTRLLQIYDKVLIVDSIPMAKAVVKMLTSQYKDCVHACDIEVAKIDVKQETPVDHGEVICFSIYSGPNANFGNGKSCIWVDVLDGGGKDILLEFAPFFEDPSIKKVWHNYSFDKHVVENYGIRVSGFYADTMHMARLWDSSRRTEGGYSLEALTGDPKVCTDKNLIGKISMKTIFGKNKLKKDGSEGKLITMAAVEELQREERKPWICYSALDSISTLVLFESLKKKLLVKDWVIDGVKRGTMFDFYERFWRPFGDLLVQMESEGMLVDRAYLAEIEKVARSQQQVAVRRFRSWASKHCPDAEYMNVGSDTQLRTLFFGGIENSKDESESLPLEKVFLVPNVNQVTAEGKKAPTKNVKITLHRLAPLEAPIETDVYTASGWPSVSGDVLRNMAGKVSAEFDFTDEPFIDDSDSASYGTAYAAFGGGQMGKEACHSIAALCEVCSIDSLISNFILPLQGSHISGKNGRIHCSLNINTETGRLSARRPNLQNQPALEKDRYKIRQAFIAAPGNSLIVADYGQLELRILAHLASCKSMLDAFEAGGDFHSRTAMNMYPHIREAVEKKQVLLEWHPQPGEEKPPVPLLKDAFGSERRKAKMLNFSIAYGKTPVGLARDWKVSRREAKETVERWYNGRKEVQRWQEERKKEAIQQRRVHTLLGRARTFPCTSNATQGQRGHIERAAINTPVQGSAADVAMCAMLEITKNERLKELGWKLLLQVHDEVILEGPTQSAEEAKAIVVHCMSYPFHGKNILKVDLSVDAKCAQNWYAAK